MNNTTIKDFQYYYKARVTDVYDGDTITVDLDLGCFLQRKGQKIRLLGINTPEVRGAQRPDGVAVRDVLRAMILDKSVIINTYLDKDDKYGRLLGVIWLEGENVNQWLIDNGHGVAYMEV